MNASAPDRDLPASTANGVGAPDAPPPRRWRGRRRRGVARFIIYAALAYVVWCATLYFAQDGMLFPRDAAPPPLPTLEHTGGTLLRLPIAEGGHVEALLVRPSTAPPDTARPVVVFFHGNAELIDFQDDVVRGYHLLGCAVFLPEYRGYGRSGGKPSQKVIVSDAVRFYDMLLERADVDASRIVFHGRSVGGGVAAALAAVRKPAALILQSTFSSVAVMAHRYGAPAFLVRHPFRTDRVIANLDVPLLIFHGTHDGIIPVAHGRRLRHLTPDADYLEYDCGHNDFPGAGNVDAYWNEIRIFLLRHGIVEREGQ